jgi:hypothetical protein
MADRNIGGETESDLSERRWFALQSPIAMLQAECRVLLEASQLADVAWRRACTRLAEFEALRDALEGQMSAAPAPARQTSVA